MVDDQIRRFPLMCKADEVNKNVLLRMFSMKWVDATRLLTTADIRFRSSASNVA